MLVNLAIENFYNFRQNTHFSMVASESDHVIEAVFDGGPFKLLLASTIYGANASGKSTLIKALAVMKKAVVGQNDWLALIEPFNLDERAMKEPTTIEVTLLEEGTCYRYGIQVFERTILEEWLILEDHKEPTMLFFRDRKTENDLPTDELLINHWQPQDNYLDEQVKQVVNWFTKLEVILDAQDIQKSIAKAKENVTQYRPYMLKLLQVADPSIRDIQVIKEGHQGNEEAGLYVIKNRRTLNGHERKLKEAFLFEDNESQGAIQLLALSIPIINALQQGHVLVIDEMDTHLHTLLTRYIIDLFNSKTNYHYGQLLFSTHDLMNISSDVFRRDQVWFVEKDRQGESHLTSLIEYQEVEAGSSHVRNYLRGRYGAIPYFLRHDWWEEGDAPIEEYETIDD